MFMIIGGDGKEYGPASVELIRSWLVAGRANLDTKAKIVGSAEWQTLADFPEFSPSAPDAPPPVPTTTRVDLASPWARLGAWFLDNVFAFVCCLPGCLVVGFSVLAEALTNRNSFAETVGNSNLLGLVLMMTGGLVVLVVQVWMLCARGQSVGKRLLGIRIVRFGDHSNPGFVGSVLMRMIVPGFIQMVPVLGFVFFVVDVLFIFRDDHRCVHDLIAGTKVVTVEAKS